jgi:hypothetical protein
VKLDKVAEIEGKIRLIGLLDDYARKGLIPANHAGEAKQKVLNEVLEDLGLVE